MQRWQYHILLCGNWYVVRYLQGAWIQCKKCKLWVQEVHESVQFKILKMEQSLRSDDTAATLKLGLQELQRWLKSGDVDKEDMAEIDNKIKALDKSIREQICTSDEKNALISLMEEILVLAMQCRQKVMSGKDEKEEKQRENASSALETSTDSKAVETSVAKVEHSEQMIAETLSTQKSPTKPIMRLDPDTILFSQDSIGGKFSDGRKLTDTFKDLLVGKLTPDDLSVMEVVRHQDKWFTLTGNRRLFVFRKLKSLGLVETVPVMEMDVEDPRVRRIFANRLSTENEGRSVEVRQSGVEEQMDIMSEEWRMGQREGSSVSHPNPAENSGSDVAEEKSKKIIPGKASKRKGASQDKTDVVQEKFTKKSTLGQYLEEYEKGSGKYVFGVTDTLNALKVGAVEILIATDSLQTVRYVLSNPVTCEETVIYLNPEQAEDRAHFTDAETQVKLELVDSQLLRDWFTNNYEEFGTKLELIKDKSDEKSRFVNEFGGVGGLLKYPVDFHSMAPVDSGLSDDFFIINHMWEYLFIISDFEEDDF